MKPVHFCILSSAILATMTIPVAAQRLAENKMPASHSKKADDPFLNGAPFTLEQMLKLVGDNPIPLRRRKEAIQSRGIDFAGTPEEIEKLKAAGASDDVLELIKSKLKQPGAAAVARPAAFKAAPTGGMTITCNPGECEISLNGKSIGPTLGSRLEVSKLTPGKWVVDFKKDGYIGRQDTVTVEAEKIAPVSADLEANRATREAYGTALFKKMIEALGGEGGVRAMASVQSVGSTTVWSRDGSSVRWTMLLRNRPDRALFQARAGGILHEVAFIGSEYNNSKNLKGPEALELPTQFGLIRDAILPAVIARVQNSEFKLVASHALPLEGEEFTLFAESDNGKISIGFDREVRPERVKITTATGVGSAIITYSDYAKSEQTFWPKSMQIKPDGWQHGIDVRFDTVELVPHFADADFKLRGKPIVNIGN